MADTPPPADEPRGLFDKLGAGLPVALTALSTIFAGLSTGELSRAMYWRSTAAQDQSKANDQWSLSGFKRDRALICDTTADTLKAMDTYRPAAARPHTPTPVVAERVGGWLRGKGEPPADDPAVRQVLAAVRAQRPDTEVLKLAREVKASKLEEQIAAAVADADAIDDQFQPEADAAKAAMASADKAERAGATAARYEVDGRRYRAESTANQWVGFLLEVRVKTSTATSDRHRRRSENFFFAMLAAQVGAVGSSLALARKQRSILWALAATAGIAAIGFGGFVYLTM